MDSADRSVTAAGLIYRLLVWLVFQSAASRLPDIQALHLLPQRLPAHPETVSRFSHAPAVSLEYSDYMLALVRLAYSGKRNVSFRGLSRFLGKKIAALYRG